MSAAIDFYFDYSSPYGYLASTRIEELARKHQRALNWHPILLGAIFKVTHQAPLTTFPLKGEYAVHDFARTAREYGTAFTQPSTFPVGAVAASRASYWIGEHNDSAIATLHTPFIHAVFHAYYVADQDISELAIIMDIATGLGIDQHSLETALGDNTVKDRLKLAVSSAIERGVFGSPMMLVDGEAFWGSDRLDQLDRWLTRGGW